MRIIHGAGYSEADRKKEFTSVVCSVRKGAGDDSVHAAEQDLGNC